MFIVLCGDKGSPGVTTTAVALASAWAGHAIAVEANPAGGDLAIRLRPEGPPFPRHQPCFRSQPPHAPIGSTTP